MEHVQRLCMISFKNCWLCGHAFSDDACEMVGYEEGQPVQSECATVHFVCQGEFPGYGILTCANPTCVQRAQDGIREYKIANERVTLSEILPSVHSVIKFWRPSRGWIQNAYFDVPQHGIYSTEQDLMCKVRFQMNSEMASGKETAVKMVLLRDILEQTPYLCRQIHAWVQRNPDRYESAVISRALAASQV